MVFLPAQEPNFSAVSGGVDSHFRRNKKLWRPPVGSSRLLQLAEGVLLLFELLIGYSKSNKMPVDLAGINSGVLWSLVGKLTKLRKSYRIGKLERFSELGNNGHSPGNGSPEVCESPNNLISGLLPRVVGHQRALSCDAVSFG